MTDSFNDDQKKAYQNKTFKEQILEEMRQASQKREERLAQEEKARQEAALAAQQAEEARLEVERLARLAEEEARRQAALEAELADLDRREQEARERELQEAEDDNRHRQEELARLEEERQTRLAEAQARHQAELDELERYEEAAREQARRDVQAREIIRLEQEKARRQHLQEVSYLTPEETEPVYDLEESFSETAIPSLSDTGTYSSFESTRETVIDWARTMAFKKSDFYTDDDDPVEGPLMTDAIDFEDDLFADNDIEGLAYEEDIMLDEQMRRQKQKTTGRLAKKLSLILGSTIVVLILATGIFGYTYVSSAIGPMDKAATDYVQVEIPSGSGNKLIGQILEKNGVIKSGLVFNYYTKFKNYTNFQSGYYNFQKSMSLDEISKLLQEGGTPEPVLPALGKIVIPEGYTLEQIAKAIAVDASSKDKASKSPFTEAAFLELVQNPDFIAQMAEKYPNLFASLPDASMVKYQLEGYLFPATYSYYEDSTLEGMVEEMIAAMDLNLAPYYNTLVEKGLTVNDVLTLASLVEKEGASDEDRQQIASVFYNRMNIGMPLQSNIAILYAMDKLGQKTTLAEDAAIDTAIVSPYNIYANLGLMPGPVDSPSLKAIEATVNPAETNYLYFVADVTTGQVYFAETYEDHDANVQTYVNSKLQ